MTNKLKGSAATNYTLSGQDFGDPKLKKAEKLREQVAQREAQLEKMSIVIRESPFMIRCRKCNKRNFISPAPITETKDLICSCGHVVAKYAAKDYGEKQRNFNAMVKAREAIEQEAIDSQII